MAESDHMVLMWWILNLLVRIEIDCRHLCHIIINPWISHLCLINSSFNQTRMATFQQHILFIIDLINVHSSRHIMLLHRSNCPSCRSRFALHAVWRHKRIIIILRLYLPKLILIPFLLFIIVFTCKVYLNEMLFAIIVFYQWLQHCHWLLTLAWFG